MLRRVELLDDLLGLRSPRGAGGGEGLAAEDLGVVDTKFWGEDLVTQPILCAGVVVPSLYGFSGRQLVTLSLNWSYEDIRLLAPVLSPCRGYWPGRGDSL